MAQTVENPLAMRETWVQSLGWEDSPEESSILAWRILMDRGAWWAAVHGVAESDTTEGLHFHFSLSCIGERKRQPTPVFLPGDSQGWQSLVGYHLWGCTESDMTEVT